jgi:hypothetical protein
MATTYYTDIQKLYVAYFNRPADTAGLAYWEGIVEAAKGSTTAVSAAFAAEAEYKTAYAGMTNADIVNAVYVNLFGRAAETAGKAYWAALLDNKSLTIDKVVTQIAAGAQGSDLVAYNNKVIAAGLFTAALDTAPEQAGYTGAAANVLAKAFMSTITDNASLTVATAPATLNASIAKVVAAGTPFTLSSGLVALNAAVAGQADFLAAADGDNDATTSTNAAAIAQAVTDKLAALEAKVAGYTAASTGVRAALLADQVTANNTKLTTDTKTAADVTAAIAKVAGLSAAISTLTAATSANTAAVNSVKAADADLAGKVASFASLNGGVVPVVDPAGTGAVAGLIVVDATTKNLVLATGVTEATKPGVTALLASSIAHEAADTTATATGKALVSAQAAVDVLDLTAGGTAALKVVAAGMTIVKLDAGVLPTSAQITTEQASLDAVYASAKAIADLANSTQAQKDAAAAAFAAADSFKTKVSTFMAADALDANPNPLVKADADAKKAVSDDNKAISDLAKAVAALDAANSIKAQLAATDSTIKLAQDAFTSHDLMLPVSLTTSVVATAGADIFVAGKVDSSILNFALLGKDSLFIGSQYTLNTGKLTTGNNAVLEAFVSQSGTDTLIKLEKTVFGSNVGGGVTPEVVTITLTGVDSTHVSLSNGIITVV